MWTYLIYDLKIKDFKETNLLFKDFESAANAAKFTRNLYVIERLNNQLN